jgi:mRNA-degrading endonuclease RelE of RelBE toxin-antitoxin system
MEIRFTVRAARQYAALLPVIRKPLEKQLRFLLANPKHPSLQIKKFDETEGIWQGRVNINWRFYFVTALASI